MLLSKDVLIIIPARSGSKRIRNKNLIKIKRKYLIEYTFSLIKNLKLEKQTYVTTDSNKIINLSKKYKIKFIKRPKKISNSKSKIENALIHLVNKEKLIRIYKWILLLQPTSPLRAKDTIENLFKILEKNKNNIDSIISFSETREDFWIKKNNFFLRENNTAPRRQQDRISKFYENGLFYLFKIKNLIRYKKIYSKKNLGILTNKIESIDINNHEDVILVKKILKSK